LLYVEIAKIIEMLIYIYKSSRLYGWMKGANIPPASLILSLRAPVFDCFMKFVNLIEIYKVVKKEVSVLRIGLFQSLIVDFTC